MENKIEATSEVVMRNDKDIEDGIVEEPPATMMRRDLRARHIHLFAIAGMIAIMPRQCS